MVIVKPSVPPVPRRLSRVGVELAGSALASGKYSKSLSVAFLLETTTRGRNAYKLKIGKYILNGRKYNNEKGNKKRDLRTLWD